MFVCVNDFKTRLKIVFLGDEAMRRSAATSCCASKAIRYPCARSLLLSKNTSVLLLIQ